jgi:S1-C subfamily serine protease
MFGAVASLPILWIFNARNEILSKLKQYWFTAVILRIIKILFSLPVFICFYILFWYIYTKYPYDFEYAESFFIIFFYYYLPFALFIIVYPFLQKISRFYSVPLSIVFIIAAPLVFYLSSPAINASASYAVQFRYFYSLAAPLGLASLIIFAISVPAFFRLISRKPQYFMFSFFLVLSFIYVFTVEYRQYGQLNGYKKFFCSYQKTKDINSPKVVRIIGSNSEGSGFFVKNNLVVTNRHVVEGEDYPKIVLPTGKFLTPIDVEFSPDYDLAFLTIDESESEYLIGIFWDETTLTSGEEALSFGYALGSEIKGSPTILPIRFENTRSMPQDETEYLQFSSPLVEGMSGGPVFDKCGGFVGVNTMTTSGTSLIIGRETLDKSVKYPSVFNEKPEKIKLEPGATPEASVYAYYYLLKARDTKGCYGLLSSNYKTKSTYEEWTARFPNVISVEVFYVEEIKPNLVYVTFGMSEWVDGEQTRKLYEGTWETVKEGDAYHLTRSYITEIESFYDMMGPDFFLNPDPKKK